MEVPDPAAHLSHLLTTLREQHSHGRAQTDSTQLQLRCGMTRRESEVALLLEEGCSNSVVAQRLDISPHTARHHTQRVLAKLGVHSRSEAGARLRRHLD
jgi:DNA-binding NarL/FixJ family response regulator